jgi:Macrocin-O-methyltransferase (TylF)
MRFPSVTFARTKTLSEFIFYILKFFKYILTLIGASLSERRLIQIQALVSYLRVGYWMKSHHFLFPRRVAGRRAVYAELAALVESRKVLYLEFGVATGASMRWWSNALKNPASVLHGFDSFEGLPEQGGPWKQGQFDQRGQIPAIDDPRVKFFKGWFNEVLPTYPVCQHEVLVVNLDADLYSSTIYVLRWLRPHLKPGTLVYFDDMSVVDQMLRAFDEFVKESGLKFKAVAADKTLAFVGVECVG